MVVKLMVVHICISGIRKCGLISFYHVLSDRRSMQEKDVLTMEYLSVSERFADAVNAGMFHGRQVLSPEQIREISPVSGMLLKKGDRKGKAGKQVRDILKAVVYNTNFCIIGIENQSEIHYAFPIRSMLYDAAAYKKQWSEIEAEHRREKDLDGTAEFLSGFSKEDKVKGVVTLVVYYGTKPWDGARDIHGLIDWDGIPEELKEIIPNYSMYLLELNRYEHLDDFQSDLKTVCRFLQNSEDKVKLKAMLNDYKDEFENMREDTYNLIGALGKMEQVQMLKENCRKEDGGFDMCKGMEDWLDEKMNEGMECGLEQGVDRVNRLIRHLVQDNRIQDLKRSAEDKEYQEQLMKEYGIG